MVKMNVNGKPVELDLDESMPLLWALRDELGLTGTKYGCGKGLCGACTVHLNGRAMRACSVPLAAAKNQEITTIEGLTSSGSHQAVGQAVCSAWQAEKVPQCGYCQPGQVMNASAFLAETPAPSGEQIRTAMAGNLCRCGTYPRIQKAIARAAEDLKHV